MKAIIIKACHFIEKEDLGKEVEILSFDGKYVEFLLNNKLTQHYFNCFKYISKNGKYLKRRPIKRLMYDVPESTSLLKESRTKISQKIKQKRKEAKKRTKICGNYTHLI